MLEIMSRGIDGVTIMAGAIRCANSKLVCELYLSCSSISWRLRVGSFLSHNRCRGGVGSLVWKLKAHEGPTILVWFASMLGWHWVFWLYGPLVFQIANPTYIVPWLDSISVILIKTTTWTDEVQFSVELPVSPCSSMDYWRRNMVWRMDGWQSNICSNIVLESSYLSAT